MKNLFVALTIAVETLTLAGCRDSEDSEPVGREIEFAPLVDSRSDPSVVADSVKDFDVLGSYVKDGSIGTFAGDGYDRIHVSRPAPAYVSWTCTPVRYWIDGTTYYFAATYPSGLDVTQTIEKGSGTADNSFVNSLTISDLTIDGKRDIVVSIPEPILASGDMSPVSLQFVHLMSKISLTFVNGFHKDDIDMEIKDVTLYGAYTHIESVTLTKKPGEPVEANWVPDESSGEALIDFDALPGGKIKEGASVTTDPIIVLPCTHDKCYTVKFTVRTYLFGIIEQDYEMFATIDGVEFSPGDSYNFTATINSSNLPDVANAVPLRLKRQ